MSARFRPVNPLLWQAYGQSELQLLPCLQQQKIAGELPQRLAQLAQHARLLEHHIV